MDRFSTNVDNSRALTGVLPVSFRFLDGASPGKSHLQDLQKEKPVEI